jgi:hypothetical protein
MGVADKNPKIPRPFNTDIESGLRSLFLLDAITPLKGDLQRLIYYDYLLVHSGDVENGPTSLHTSLPYRSGEWLVRRRLIQNGLDLMFSKELVVKEFDRNAGILYSASPLTNSFLKHLATNYANDLRARAQWIHERFSTISDSELSDLMLKHLGEWGAEFSFSDFEEYEPN